MANYKVLKPKIIKWEGGFVGNIDGKIATNKGVTLETFQHFFGSNKTPEDLKHITDAQWDYIFIQGYWNRWRANEIKSQSIANLLVDWVWASGVYGIKYAQIVLNVQPDGKVGPKTLAAIDNWKDKKDLFSKLWQKRKYHFEHIAAMDPRKTKFLKGWLNRLNDFKFEDS